ncbi:MAG TPA: PAS domain-containing protein [Burkholderiaceae bacterium]|nr:PAS domain-containing protein [Burkholderiaceae bacterium]
MPVPQPDDDDRRAAAPSGPTPPGSPVLDALPVAVAVWDRDKRNVYANAAMKQLLGMASELRPGIHLRDAIGARAYEEGIPYREAALSGQPQEHVTRVERSSGSREHRVKYLPWRDATDRVVGYVAIAEDVTAERKARDTRLALEASERLYRVLSDASPLGVYHTDAAGQCTYTNRRWHEICGLTLQESLGDGWVRTLHPSDRDAVFERWQHTAAAGGQFSMEYKVLRPDGTVRSVRSHACALTDAQGAIEGFVGTVEDVTELREADARRRESEAHASELDALLAEREEMLQVLAHEVRQPLNNASAALQSAVALLAERGEQDATQRLARAQLVMGMVLSGIDNTLAASALLASNARPTLADVDIDTLVAVTVRDLPTADRARVRVERATPTRTATLDMGLMRLALRNVLANAAEHSPPWSVVTLRIADSDEPLAILFDVIDAGSGIDPAVLPRLFDRGTHGRKASGRSGHGLGLYIVRRALELHGGRAEVLSTGPGGTTIRLTVNQGGLE